VIRYKIIPLTKVPAVQSRWLFRLNRSDSNFGGLSGRNLPIPQRTPNITANYQNQKELKKKRIALKCDLNI
jgi:hypothetical protein